jgi:hypothetical protein
MYPATTAAAENFFISIAKNFGLYKALIKSKERSDIV